MPQSVQNLGKLIKMKILITGGAGFIGFHLANALLALGHEIIAIDSITDYYDPNLKQARLKDLSSHQNFEFHKLDVNQIDEIRKLNGIEQVQIVINLAAQAGVRYSLENPFAYSHSNLNGHLSILEVVRNLPQKPLLIYASSSSVYGNNSTAPFKETEALSQPVSLYAATKLADELMSYSYASLYSLKQIGLRFFTVYGPWGRPDMAYWGFSEAILAGKPIRVFNNGNLRRDFTYIDDIVDGIVRIATTETKFDAGQVPHKIYNIGNNNPVQLMVFINELENALGKKAILEMHEMQKGDVYETSADISLIKADYGFEPKTNLKDGLKEFAKWYSYWNIEK